MVLTVTRIEFYFWLSFVLHVIKASPLAKILQLLLVDILVLFIYLSHVSGMYKCLKFHQQLSNSKR